MYDALVGLADLVGRVLSALAQRALVVIAIDDRRQLGVRSRAQLARRVRAPSTSRFEPHRTGGGRLIRSSSPGDGINPARFRS